MNIEQIVEVLRDLQAKVFYGRYKEIEQHESECDAEHDYDIALESAIKILRGME